jgi:MipA family protein
MSPVKHFLTAGAVGLSLALLSPALHAAEATSSGWTITLKGNGGVSPAWEGSSDLSPYLVPGLSMRRMGSPLSFSAPDDAPSIALFDEGWLKAGVAGRLRGPRRSGDYSQLWGLQNIDWTVEVGGFAEFWPMEKFRARIDLRHGFSGHHGNVVDLSADWVERLGPWTLSAGPRMTLGDAGYMNKLFGVTFYEALMNWRVSPYNAPGGAKSVGLAGSVGYQWSPSWTTTGYVKYNRLIGPAGSSPIVTNLGSRNQLTLGAIAAYSFDWAGF